MKVYLSSDNAFDDGILVHRLACFRRSQSHVNANSFFPFCWLEGNALHWQARHEVCSEFIVHKFKESTATGVIIGQFYHTAENVGINLSTPFVHDHFEAGPEGPDLEG